MSFKTTKTVWDFWSAIAQENCWSSTQKEGTFLGGTILLCYGAPKKSRL